MRISPSDMDVGVRRKPAPIIVGFGDLVGCD